MKTQRKKIKLMKSFKSFDFLFSKSFRVKMDYGKIHQDAIIVSLIILIVSLHALALLVIQMPSNRNYSQSFHSVHILIYNVVIVGEILQLFVFANGIQLRMSFMADQLKSSRSFCSTAVNLKKLLFVLHDTNELMKECFGLPLLITMMEIYSRILFSSYWLGVSFWKVQYAVLHGSNLSFQVLSV